jgi:hypothetical protein
MHDRMLRGGSQFGRMPDKHLCRYVRQLGSLAAEEARDGRSQKATRGRRQLRWETAPATT